MRKIFPLYLFPLLLSFAAIPAQAEQSRQDGASEGAVVARVNGVPIYERELNESLALRFNKRKRMGMTGNMAPEVEYAIKMQILDELIDGAVIYQAVEATEGLPDVEEDVKQRILGLAATFGSEEKYDQFLNTKNSSLEKKKEYFRKSFLTQAYFDKLGLTNPEIPEEEIRELYESQKKGFVIPEQVKFSQVYLEVPKDASREQKEKIAGYAEEARKMLLDGVGFAEVVERLSAKHEDIKISGGDRGFVKKGTLPEKVDDVAFSIQPWKISDVIESEFGFHVISVAEKKPSGFTPYEKVRDFLLRYLQSNRVQDNVAKHTRELRDKAKIEILLKKPTETEEIAGEEKGASG